MIERREYLEQLKKWKDEKVIKVITGIRRCGKSTLLQLFEEYLLNTGVSKNQIIKLNFEYLEYEELSDYKKLYSYITERLNKTGTTYVFLDEIQQVTDFQKAVDSLYVKDNVDIYMTGSNAYLLSGELATLLSGRYVEINMLPFSFAEFYGLDPSGNKDAAFSRYLANGGMPYVANLGDDNEKISTYLEGIYNTIIIKDVEQRQKKKAEDPNDRKVTDISLLNNIARFLAGSIGNPVSVKSIADYITSGGRKISQNTVSDYVKALTEPYVFYMAERYNVLGKQLLKNNPKVYIVDLGLRRYMLARQKYDLGFSLENVIYFELIRRGFKVNVGKTDNGEIDFAARKGDGVYYYQVTASMTEETTFKREMAPLEALTDNYPKTVITLDRFTLGDYNGIKVVNAVDWLLDKS